MSPQITRYVVWTALLTLMSGPAIGAKLKPPVSCPSTSPLPPAVAPKRPGGAAHTPVRVVADRVELEGELSVFSGNVEVQYEDETVFADRVVYDRIKDEIEASGSVRVRNAAGDAIDATFLQVQRTANTGYTESVVFRFRGDRARGDARRIYFRSRDLVELEKARYTLCEPGQDDWFIVASDMELDYERDMGVAKHAYITFMSVPIFYWPYLSFPLSDARKSGLLAPYFGSDRNSGLFIGAPYYLNLAPNYDATITPRFLEKRGLQFLTEGRYLGSNRDGGINLDYLKDDRVLGRDRWAARYTHHEYVNPLLTAEANYNRFSDQRYLTDFAIGVVNATTTHVPQKLETRYGDETWRGLARLFAYQTLDPNILPADTPYKRLPEIDATATVPGRSGRGRYEFDGSLINFQHDAKVSGQRVTLYPAATLPWRNSYAFVLPRAALRYNKYNLEKVPADSNSLQDENPTLSVPIYSIDSGLIFERPIEIGGSTHTQTIEPRLFYVYIPFRNQDGLPNFDTGPQDFTYSNLFRENRFYGGDRVGDTNHIAFGVTTRLLDPVGAEWLRLSLGEIYYFDEQRVFTREERNALPAGFVQKEASSLVEQSRLRLGHPWYLRNDLQWDPYVSDVRKSSTYLQYSPRPEDILNIGHLFSNLPTAATTTTTPQEEQIELSTQWRVGQRWSVLGQFVYSLSSHSNRESYLGFEYNACCWLGRFYAQQVIDPFRGQINRYFFEFELSGLVRLGAPKITPLSRGAFAFQD